jgi:4-amino-4-deoxy-L-arabinose transferase-like glycosyltransferase
VLVACAVAAVFAVGAGPASYSVATVGHALSGNNVAAGPDGVSRGMGAGGGGPQGGTRPSRAVMGGGAGLSDEAISWLQANQGDVTYLLAAVGSQATSQIIIDTGEPVVTIGGFNGQDPAPTVSELAQIVADGKLKYVLLSESGGPGGGASDITAWVQEHGTVVDAVDTGSGTLYAVG